MAMFPAAAICAVAFVLASLTVAAEGSRDCVASGYSCLPKERCPADRRKPEYGGCATVCCNTRSSNDCVLNGGECNPKSRSCYEEAQYSPSCGSGQKCCIWLN
ncbi:carboxypeptidase inhibitor-like [Ornithodoros turicata]|uniref:carboxypeptidase inhibitor-like n=1 Tax=Ornithodoros turicata TaxID=34597 RepID=UPI0031399785